MSDDFAFETDARPTATFEVAGEAERVGPWAAIGWLLFVILLVCTPAIVAATWAALL